MNIRLLLVEDDIDLCRSLSDYLSLEGYHLSTASSIAACKNLNVMSMQLILLDWMLPDGQGIDLLKHWRKVGATTPVIMLTARSLLVDKVLGLESGAQDYVTKPFELRELLARIRVHTHGANVKSSQALLSFQYLEYNIDEKLFYFKGIKQNLPKNEYLLLKLFVENPGKVFTRDEILNLVWGYEKFPTTRTVDNHVLALRQRFGDECIETLRGLGYRFALTKSNKNETIS